MAFENYSKRRNNLPVPVLAEPESSTRSSDRNRRVSGEARESTRMLSVAERQADRTKPTRNVKNESESRGGQRFDRKKYMREYMKKKRAEPKMCRHCGKENP